MKTIFSAILGAVLVVSLSACTGSEKSRLGSFNVNKNGFKSNNSTEHITMSPPFTVSASADYSKGGSYVPATVIIVPTHDLDTLDVTWSPPKGAALAAGKQMSQLSSESLHSGEKITIEAGFQLEGQATEPVTVTVKATARGMEFGTAVGVWLGPVVKPASNPNNKVLTGPDGKKYELIPIGQ